MNTRLKISVVLIAKDAAELLLECLQSVSWADEIILLDSNSSDSTVDIAKHYGAQVYHTDKWHGYGKQRQLAQSYAIHPMVLMIDCDERLTPELQRSILKVLEQPATEYVYSIARRNRFLGRFMQHSGWYPDRVIRLYPCHYHYNDNQVHESLEIKKNQIIPLKGDMLHLTCQDFSDFQWKQFSYAKIWARKCHEEGRYHGIAAIFGHTVNAFFKTLVLRAGFLDGCHGWLLAVVNAQYTFNKYTALWALNHASRNRKL